jgi:flagellar biosynthesis protein FlhF
MKVKKFVAPTMPEAMKMIRTELGNDAVILNSKVIQKGGLFGIFTKKNIEVIAAIDSDTNQPKLHVQQKLPSREFQNKNLPREQSNRDNSSQLLKEINDLKLLIKNITQKEASTNQNYPAPILEMNCLLVEQEFEEKIRREVIEKLLERWYVNGASTEKSEVRLWLREELVHRMERLEFGGIDYKKQFVNVVGPTGVGKTTTIAKIAAHCMLKQGKRVAFITTDTYRIAAIEQLKTYAQILDVPVEVAYSIDDFKKAKERFSNFDLVLIDTAGRNFRNKEYIQDLKKVIDFNEEMDTMLVLALTSKFSDMNTIVEQFSLVDIKRFIFTKVDETSQYGAMVNLMLNYQIGAAYMTNGQNVPDDIIEASSNQIIKTLFGVKSYERSS